MEPIIDILKYDPYNPLLFNTGLFLLLFAAVVLIYRILARHRTAKLLFIILFSLYFYYKSSAEYCFILLGVCVSDYVIGSLLQRTQSRLGRRLWVALNVVLNVGMLVYFKYFNLIYSTFASIAGTSFDALDIILPAGISFFTFRSISYIVDIYRGTITACRSFFTYVAYLTFFPPLLAGPVVRAKDMLPQFSRNPEPSQAMVSAGLFMIICGLVKKAFVADYIGQNFVDRVFDNPALYSGFENLIGMYGFTIQLYCDFSGYSDMAIGLALLLGFHFKDNFRSPFKSQNPTEFWRRWHISLSFWLRDYLYIPLGGNRCSRKRRHFNLFTTMVLGGLWHGASWMYLIWGGMQGALLIGHKELHKALPRPRRVGRLRRAMNIFITFNLLAITFVFFRARSLDAVGDMATQIFTNFHLSVAPQFIDGYLMIALAIIFGYVLHFLPERWTSRAKAMYHRTPLLLQTAILVLILLLVIQVRSSDIVPFIYLQY